MSSPVKKPADRALATNRRARRDYEVLQKFEAGIELLGTEVKSIRAGDVSLNESYARVEDRQVMLHGMHIKPYEYGHQQNHDPVRPRRLLLHKREIQRLFGLVTVKGQALVPLRIYLKRNLVKVELGLCRGKHAEDKREALKRRTADREAQRAIAQASRTRNS